MGESAKATGGINVKGNRRGMNDAARDGLARGRALVLERRKQGAYNRTPAERRLTANAAKVIANDVRRFVEAHKVNPGILADAAVGEILSKLWETTRILKPFRTYARRRAAEAVALERRGVKEENPELRDEAAGIVQLLLPVLDQLRRSDRYTTDVALRLAEISNRLKPGNGRGYLEERYGDGASARGRDEEGEVPPEAEKAEVLEEVAAEPAGSPDTATSGDAPPPPDEPLPGPPPE